jgi:sugar/nucleoside kinase (ribokinase family)
VDQIVTIGHVARDEFSGEDWRCGGSAFYGAVTCARLGCAVAMISPIGAAERDRFASACEGFGIALHALESSATTTFAFSLREGRRELRLLARARSIGWSDVPIALRDAPAVLLGSVIGEHQEELVARLTGRDPVLAAQGELRRADSRGIVRKTGWRRAPVFLPHLGAVVVSEEDLGRDLAPAMSWSRHATVVVTRADRGAALLHVGRRVDVAAYKPTRIVDPTGAGDAFAAGLLVARYEGASWPEAMDFANCVASFCLEGVGVSGLADRPAVADRRLNGERLPV